MNLSILNQIANFSEKNEFYIIKILTFNKWSSLFRSLTFSEACFLTYVSYGADFDVSIDAIVALANQKQNGV